MKSYKALIVGNGKVGQELRFQLQDLGWEVVHSPARDNIPLFKVEVTHVDIVFLCISTKDKGEAALAYMLAALEMNKPVVTCEKAALAYHFEKLSAFYPHMIGTMATVGGGSRILETLSIPGFRPVQKVQGILNGTLNFISYWLQQGQKIDEVLAEANKLGLTERANVPFGEIIKGELQDVLLKMTLMVNYFIVEPGGWVTPDIFNTFLIDDETALQLLSDRKLRFMVSITRDRIARDNEWQIYASVAGYHVIGTFLDTKEYAGSQRPIGAENCLYIEASPTDYHEKSGPGAGPQCTAGAMVTDALQLLSSGRK